MQILPFDAEQPLYDMDVVIAGYAVHIDVHWNATENAWFFDMFEPDGTVIVSGVKIVLGVPLARRTEHPLMREGCIVVRDLSGGSRDAGRDDLGTRVVVLHYTSQEIVASLQAQRG